MTQRWFHLLLRLFPDASERRHVEMVDALAETGMTRRSVVRESSALVWAALVAWRIHLGTTRGMRESLHVGALLWFGFLVGIGPWSRFGGSFGDQPFQLGRNAHPAHFAIAGALLVAAMLALAWGRLPAVLLGALGIVVAANTNRVGDWQLVRSLVYELRWLGVALAAVVTTWQRRRVGVSVIAAGFSAVVAVWLIVELGVSTTYGHTLTVGMPEMLQLTQGGHFSQWIPVVAAALLLLLPWVFPGGVAFLAAMVMHLAIVEPWPALVVALYLAAATGIRLVMPLTDISISWRQPDNL